MKIIGYIAVTVTGLVLSTILNGWALSKLWLWFIVATFDIRPLSIPAAIGLALVVGYLTQRTGSDKACEDKSFGDKLGEGFVHAVVKPLFALLFGLIIKQWMP